MSVTVWNGRWTFQRTESPEAMSTKDPPKSKIGLVVAEEAATAGGAAAAGMTIAGPTGAALAAGAAVGIKGFIATMKHVVGRVAAARVQAFEDEIATAAASSAPEQ